MAAVAAPIAPAGALSPRQRRALDAICDTFHPGTAELGAADAFIELFGSELRPAELRRLLGLLSLFGCGASSDCRRSAASGSSSRGATAGR